MEVLVLDGKNYVKASRAARELGYATDYVGQLCRSGQVDAHLIGRTWYVNQDELGTHRVEKKRMSRIKAREYAKKSIEEHRKKTQTTKNVYKNIDIQYESDESELIPTTKKLEVVSEKTTGSSSSIDPESLGDEQLVMNKGEKVVMSGEIDVVDVTDGVADQDTIILKPSKSKKSSPEKTNFSSRVAPKGPKLSNTTSFSERLEIVGEENKQVPTKEIEAIITDEKLQAAPKGKKGSLFPYLACTFILLALLLVSISTTSTVTYSEGVVSVDTEVSIQKNIEIILRNI